VYEAVRRARDIAGIYAIELEHVAPIQRAWRSARGLASNYRSGDVRVTTRSRLAVIFAGMLLGRSRHWRRKHFHIGCKNTAWDAKIRCAFLRLTRAVTNNQGTADERGGPNRHLVRPPNRERTVS